MSRPPEQAHVVIVGAGFAGLGCAKELAKHDDVRVTLIDRHNYHQFLPLLYQVATSQLAASDVAIAIRKEFRKHPNVDVKMAEVVSVDPTALAVRLNDGQEIAGSHLVLAAGSRPNFFHTPGADQHAFPLYSLEDAERLRSRILTVFEDADRDPALVEKGALNFVVVGAGATGTEVAGALAEMIRDVMPSEYHDLAIQRAKVTLVDAGHAVLGPFSPTHTSTPRRRWSETASRFGLGSPSRRSAGPRHAVGRNDHPHEVRHLGRRPHGGPARGELRIAQGRGGRIDVLPDLTVADHPRLYALGDFANVPGPDGKAFPQLGSVALQAGRWAAKNIRADLDGKPRTEFHYHDKGIMAMIGRNAAVAEVGKHRHELHGAIAFVAWLGVHVVLLSGVRQRVDAFVSWAWDYFTKSRGPQVLDRSDVARIDWNDDEQDVVLFVAEQPSAPRAKT